MQEFIILGVVMILALGAYWSLVIFPRQRDFQKQQKYVQTLQVGDEMITYGGIVVRVIAIDADHGTAEVEIADGVVIRILTAALVRPYDREELARSIRMARGERADVE
ncbi:MAG: preprotein translocase subunit YajC [bacterium]|nr:preprotein translocase subunit YajC [bacterium]